MHRSATRQDGANVEEGSVRGPGFLGWRGESRYVRSACAPFRDLCRLPMVRVDELRVSEGFQPEVGWPQPPRLDHTKRVKILRRYPAGCCARVCGSDSPLQTAAQWTVLNSSVPILNLGVVLWTPPIGHVSLCLDESIRLKVFNGRFPRVGLPVRSSCVSIKKN